MKPSPNSLRINLQEKDSKNPQKKWKINSEVFRNHASNTMSFIKQRTLKKRRTGGKHCVSSSSKTQHWPKNTFPTWKYLSARPVPSKQFSWMLMSSSSLRTLTWRPCYDCKNNCCSKESIMTNKDQIRKNSQWRITSNRNKTNTMTL